MINQDIQDKINDLRGYSLLLSGLGKEIYEGDHKYTQEAFFVLSKNIEDTVKELEDHLTKELK